MKKAHRLSWEIHKGAIPDEGSDDYHGVCVLHRCDNRRCVNPGHLFLGSHTDNMQDMERKGRSRHLAGELHGSAKLTLSDVMAIRSDERSHRVIAESYGVTKAAVGLIKRRKTWKMAEGSS